ncbi:hypothetical protein BUALT_Bualt07G0122500 [Buddleja alternifolia]|uniref:Transposase n=1 Tax=Buddleja alternifolia TaxID=168488 RepID=A0AAV6XGV0_9LAMI|nr:hypothetical protein BUALT_Bualt07G0122500 [Buddleja alternifolia]
MLPKGHKLPDSFYSSKKVVALLGLGVEKIDACENDCMLYWKNEKELQQCKICHHPRFKPKKRGKKKGHKDISFKQLNYLPLIPRLQRLYMSKTTAEHMIWHKESPSEEGKLCHPRDGEAWKHFDRTYPTFAVEGRNVRLGLSADGFNPHNQTSRPYSCWPVIVTPYNLPPWMCMDHPYMFLTLLVPGPRSPGRSLDVYLQPLIDELKTLWNDGVETYDVSKKQNFQMRASLMWTVSDFPAYGMLSGWSTHGKLSCPYCMSGIKSFRLKHGRKPCFFDCHRQFLPLNHPYRYQKDNFTKGRIEIDPPFIRLTGEELEAVVASLPTIEFGKTKDKERIEGFGETHNWLKRSIFWDLPYWNTNLIRHNLDVMHIEKNMFDNVFNTVMDVKGKSKDNLNARLDLQSICKRWDLELKEVNEKYLKPKASYTLSKDQRQIVLKWIKNLRLPDGYVSNLARCVNLDDCSLHGMKSHDCHVFMQRLLPLAFRDLLPESVWNGLTELSQLYDAEKQAQIPNLTHKSLGVMRDNEFATWFCNYASVGDVYQELTSDPACIILDNELDDVAILTDANRQEEEVNPNELQPSRRELEEEFESDELEIGSMDLNEEELEEEESGNDNDLTSDDIIMSATRGKVKRRLMSAAGHVSFTSMLTGNVSNLGDLELGLQPDEDKDEEVVEEVQEEVDKEVDEDIDEGIEEQHDEHTSEQHDPANLEIKDKIELDELGREILIIEGKNFISVAAPRSMLGDMRGWYTDVWPTFSKIPEHVKGYHFERFKETYTKLKEIRSQGSGNTILSPQGSSTFIPEAWAEACGGIKNRHNSYGFGKSNSGSFTFSGTIPSNNTSNLEVEQLKEELQNMKNKQFEMDEKINQLLAITRANHSNFSGHHFSPGQYSSPQYSGPSPGQYPPSASAPAGQYPPPAPAPAHSQYTATGSGQYPPPAPAPAHSQYTATGSGQYPPPTPGYYPTPPPGYFMTPATQFHVPGNYIAPGQHPPVPTQQSDQLPSPDQRHSQE